MTVPLSQANVHASGMNGDGGDAAAAIVKVTCPRCGDLDLSPDDVEIPLPSLDSPTSSRFACSSNAASRPIILPFI